MLATVYFSNLQCNLPTANHLLKLYISTKHNSKRSWAISVLCPASQSLEEDSSGDPLLPSPNIKFPKLEVRNKPYFPDQQYPEAEIKQNNH